MCAKPEPSGQRRLALAALFFLLIVPGFVRAQEARPDTVRTHLRARDTLAARRDTAVADSSKGSGVKSKSPGTAMLLSAVLPGAGQFYNESYWKVPIVAGLGGYFVSQWFSNNRLYKDYRSQYRASIGPGNPYGDSRFLTLREFYKDQRDSFTWYFLILYLVNIADAYVDASLYGFSVSGDLSHQQLPMIPGLPQVSFTVRYRF